MTFLSFIGGIDYDPFIRGVLVVATGVLVLMGSVYVLLATNSGARTGMLLALCGFFGWMTIMASIWWIYGIGWKGDSPTWHVLEVNRGDLIEAEFEPARELGAIIDEQTGGPDGVEEFFAEAEETGESPRLGDWDGVLLSNPARGEAQATVDAFLVGAKEFGSNLEYTNVAAFETGGKKKRDPSLGCKGQNNPFKILFGEGGDCYERAWVKLQTMAQLRHPPRYTVIMVHGVEERSLVNRPGQPPPLKRADPSKPIVSVILERDLGNVRFKPFMTMIGSGILFAAFAWRLHERDRREAKNTALVPTRG